MNIKGFMHELMVGVFADERTHAALVKLITDEKTQTAMENLLGKLLVQRIMPLVPVAAGVAATAAVNEALKRFPGLEHAVDTTIEAVGSIDEARNALNDLIPDVDFGVGALDQLADFWRPK